jgi:beta-lactamase superfamily II metal-dependent hydrolase
MHKDIFFDSSLTFELNVIGYKTKGECVLAVLKADGKVAFVGLIDCYRDAEGNEAIRILHDAGRKHFDFVCWTHPHDDHSIGMDEVVQNYCDHDTFFWMPWMGTKDTSPFSREARATYQSLFDVIELKKKAKMHVNTVSNGMRLESFLCRKNDGFSKYRFSIFSFAPSGELLTANLVNNVKTVGNLFSVGLNISIGEFNVMLAGDVENRTFAIIPDFDIVAPIDYIKIPHHASSSGVGLVEKLKNLDIDAPSIASTTVFRTHSLPDPSVLSVYKRWSPQMQVYSSGSIDGNKDDLRYGIVQTRFDILQKEEVAIETELFGNAVQV